MWASKITPGKWKLRNPTVVQTRASDVQESLKVLQFRFGKKVSFRPVVFSPGLTRYMVDGELRAESEIVSLAAMRRLKLAAIA